jgi:hypothetical protein
MVGAFGVALTGPANTPLATATNITVRVRAADITCHEFLEPYAAVDAIVGMVGAAFSATHVSDVSVVVDQGATITSTTPEAPLNSDVYATWVGSVGVAVTGGAARAITGGVSVQVAGPSTTVAGVAPVVGQFGTLTFVLGVSAIGVATSADVEMQA